jgi:homocitrate synthase NifV
MQEKTKNALKGEIIIVDTTLRDGEQSAGVVFANEEKIRIAKLLDEVGVHQIEVGIPAMEGKEKEAIKKIAKMPLKASILAWNRAIVADLYHSLECEVDAVCLSMSASDIHIKYKLNKDRDWVLRNIEASTKEAKKYDLYVSVNAEDASRADIDFLIKFAQVAKDSGADRLRFCDTLGKLTPLQTYKIIKQLIERVNIPIEMHTHNDFGMATANLIAGIEAGAKFANTTVNGLGERTGNAALEEVVMALKYTLNIDLGLNTKKFMELCQYVAKASGREIPPWKPIVGENVFSHEAGIHADGVYKDPRNYENFPPEEVGNKRKIIIGKHSGTSTIIEVLKKYGIGIDRVTAAEILAQVRAMSISLKRALTEMELVYLYEDYIAEKGGV